jgi:two-component system response regulator HydG
MAIRKALELTKNNKSKTAKLLGVDRKTLYNKLDQYGIEK